MTEAHLETNAEKEEREDQDELDRIERRLAELAEKRMQRMKGSTMHTKSTTPKATSHKVPKETMDATSDVDDLEDDICDKNTKRNKVDGPTAGLRKNTFISNDELKDHIVKLIDLCNGLQSILVSVSVYNGLTKDGSIYKHINDTYGLQIKVLRVRGRPSKECVESGLIRLSRVDW